MDQSNKAINERVYQMKKHFDRLDKQNNSQQIFREHGTLTDPVIHTSDKKNDDAAHAQDDNENIYHNFEEKQDGNVVDYAKMMSLCNGDKSYFTSVYIGGSSIFKTTNTIKFIQNWSYVRPTRTLLGVVLFAQDDATILQYKKALVGKENATTIPYVDFYSTFDHNWSPLRDLTWFSSRDKDYEDVLVIFEDLGSSMRTSKYINKVLRDIFERDAHHLGLSCFVTLQSLAGSGNVQMSMSPILENSNYIFLSSTSIGSSILTELQKRFFSGRNKLLHIVAKLCFSDYTYEYL